MINDILNFWFKDLEPQQWFMKDEAFDQTIRDRFEATYWDIVNGQCEDWLQSAEGNLAYVVVLDQFSRNMFRDTPQAFAGDHLALAAAQNAVSQGFDQQVTPQQRTFFYMPYMHSEDPAVHITAVELFTAHGNKMNLEYEFKHKAIIDRFGRYPHRNQILGRESTSEEVEFLKGPDSSF